MSRNGAELARLAAEHPDLPIVPMVWQEVVCDDTCSYWMGSFGKCEVGKYITGEERYFIKDYDDEETVLLGVIGYDAYEALPDEEVKQKYENLPWIEAILVYVELPEE